MIGRAYSPEVRRRVAFVDDHPILLQGLIASFSADRRVDVVASGSTSAEARRIAADVAPDVLVLDLDLHDEPANRTIRAIKRESPQVAIVVLTALDDSVARDELLRAGASTYLTKATTPTDLVEQVLAAKAATSPVQTASRTRSSSSVLTDQEMRVLRMIAMQWPTRQIAISLGISDATVKRHLANLYKKMQVRSRDAAVGKAHLLGLLDE